MNLFKAIIFITILLIAFTATGAIIFLSRNLDTLEVSPKTSIPSALTLDESSDSNTQQDSTLTLAINPKSQTLRVGQTFSVYVTARSPREILAVDLYLTYNPQVLQFVAIEPATYFPNPIEAKKSHDSTSGSILYSLASLTPTSTSGNLAKVTFTVKARSTQAVISIHQDTLASLKGAVEAESQMQNGTFLIQ